MIDLRHNICVMFSKRCLLILILCPFCLFGVIEYNVTFKGIQDSDLLSSLREASDLVILERHPPKTLAALKQRAESDIANIVDTLHKRAYYNAKVKYEILSEFSPVQIEYFIDKGPVYPITHVHISPSDFALPLDSLGIEIGEAATPKAIYQAEEALIQWLNCKGYPYAHISEKQVIADQKTKSISLSFNVVAGQRSTFGPVTIAGNCRVLESYIRRRVQWKEGDTFDPNQITCTANAINSSGLFSLVQITYPEEPTENGSLPIHIELDEAKHRSIALGLSYSTQRGPGFTTEWQNRNFGGTGNRLFFDANVLQLVQHATLEYVIPEFRTQNQDFIWALEAEHDDTEGFDETWVSASGRIERKLNRFVNFSYGLQYKQLWVTNSDTNGDYGLLKAPIHWRWSSANDCLDPTYGVTLYTKLIPTFQVSNNPFFYTIGNLSLSAYLPFDNSRFVLASRMQFGTVFGSSRKEIPASERLYAGSETTLRGYNYWTVSPLDENNDPIGGRSLLVYSLEGRWRINEKWGGVLFYDVGNVYKDPFPRFDEKMLQSVGVGARYFTPVGPIRVDLAFPLNPRKGIDNSFQLYFSIGQSF